MIDRLTKLATLALLGVLPLMLYSRAEDVFFGPWRAAEWVYLGCAFVLLGFRWAIRRSGPVVSAVTLPWLLFAAWVLLATAWSVNPTDSWRRALDLVGGVTALWLGIAAAREWERLKTIVLWSVSLCSLYGMVQVLGFDWLPWSTGFGGRAFGTLGNPNYYAGHLLLVLPLAVVSLVPGRGTTGGSRLLTGALALLLLVGFFFSQVRGAWLAGGAAVVWAAAWLIGRGALGEAEKKTLLRTAGVTVAVFAAILIASGDVRSRFASVVSFGGYDATGRRYLWTVATRIWMERGLTGFGTGSYRFEFPRFQHLGATMGMPQFKPYNYSEHAHFELLQFGAELGAVGVGLFLWGLAAWVVRWRRTMRACSSPERHDEWWVQLGLGTALFGSFAYGWVNFPFQIVPTALLWWGLLGVSLGRMRVQERVWRLPAGGAVAAGVFLVFLGISSAILCSSELIGSSYLRGLHGRLTIGDNVIAREYGVRAAKMLPHDVRVFRWLSRLGVVEGDVALVEESVRTRLKIHPHLLDALADRATVQRRLGNRDLAELRYRELLARAPNFVSAWGDLGAIYFEKEEYELAVEAFARAVEIQDSNAMWHHNLASAYGILKRYREALAADERAIERDPGFMDAYVGIALSARALGELDRARAAARQAYTLAPEDPRALGLLQKLQ